MKQVLGCTILSKLLIFGGAFATPIFAQTTSSLHIAYPPPEHETTAEKIFLIGTAAAESKVTVNGQKITNRSSQGHFAPSFPLKIGENIFTIRHQNELQQIKVTRISAEPEIPEEVAFAPDSLTPAVDFARLPEELICFGAVAPPKAEVLVRLGGKTIPLLAQAENINLPANSSVLTDENTPNSTVNSGKYSGCTTFNVTKNLGKPIFELQLEGQRIIQEGKGEITILDPQEISVVEVIADAGVARTGASTNYSRLTPLPKKTRARVTGMEGEWLRLDYGAWIKEAETQPVAANIPPHSLIRSITSRQIEGATEIIFPLQIPVPVKIQQGDRQITLTLFNSTAQTDTIRLDNDPVIKRLDWQQTSPTQIDYTFELKNEQQWGYDFRYEGTSLIFTLRHPPEIFSKRNSSLVEGNNRIINRAISTNSDQPLFNTRILLDPGHGGKESGAQGPTGYPEKAINLVISKLLEEELTKLGATVYLTREKDIDVSLQERIEMINQIKPDLALSIHYNALPDSGDAINTKGISTFWYHPQAHDFALFIHNYLIADLNRPDAGTFWNNLALTRPHTAPSILLELGFMINPEEFEWIINTTEQQKLANLIAQGIKQWFLSTK